MYDVMLSQLNYLAGAWLNAGELPERFANSSHPYIVPAQIFPTADGWLTLFITHDQFWQKFCHEIGKAEWVDRSRVRDRWRAGATIASASLEAITQQLADRQRAQLGEAPGAARRRRGRNRHAGRGAVERAGAQTASSSSSSAPASLGLRAVGSPIKFSDSSPHYGAPPLLDEHRDEVLRQCPA